MTTETPSTRPVKYAVLEWRNSQGEVFENYKEGTVCYQKGCGGAFYTGTAVDHYDDGAKSIEGGFLEGYAHGEEMWWFENGNKNSLVTYRRGERHGPHLVWYEGGQLQVMFATRMANVMGGMRCITKAARCAQRLTSLMTNLMGLIPLGLRTAIIVVNASSRPARKLSVVNGKRMVPRRNSATGKRTAAKPDPF